MQFPREVERIIEIKYIFYFVMLFRYIKKRKIMYSFLFQFDKNLLERRNIRKLIFDVISFYCPVVCYVACWWTIYVIAISRNDS